MRLIFLITLMTLLLVACGPESSAERGASTAPCTETQECADDAVAGCVRQFTAACEYQYRCEMSDQWVLEREWGYADAESCTAVLTDKNCTSVEADILAGEKEFVSGKLEQCVDNYDTMACVADLAALVAVKALRICDEALRRVD